MKRWLLICVLLIGVFGLVGCDMGKRSRVEILEEKVADLEQILLEADIAYRMDIILSYGKPLNLKYNRPWVSFERWDRLVTKLTNQKLFNLPSDFFIIRTEEASPIDLPQLKADFDLLVETLGYEKKHYQARDVFERKPFKFGQEDLCDDSLLH